MNKPSYPHPVIAREGWPFLAGIVLVSILVSFWSGWASVPFWLLSLFVLQFFRDPGRMAPDGRLNVLSPADGRIVAVEETRDIYADRQALKISVFMNVFNVHSNRAPVKGIVQKVTYFPGKFLNAALDKASLENERNATVILTPEGHTVTAVQVAGLVAKRILCYIKPNDPLYAGERYGFIRFGSRVDVYLPLDARVRVALGDKVQATSTVLAELPEPVVASQVSEAVVPAAQPDAANVVEPSAPDHVTQPAPGAPEASSAVPATHLNASSPDATAPGTAAETSDTPRSGTAS